MGNEVDREAAWSLLCEYTHGESLRKHGLAVETVMRSYAKKFGEDELRWGVTGLLHDFDYERWPQIPDHPIKGSEILRERGYPEDVVRAILGHANHTGIPRDTRMAQVLYAVDELSGFVTAVALVRPTKSIHEVEVASVKKKFKDKAFARGVNRDDISQSIQELGWNQDEHIQFVIDSLKGNAAPLGLSGIVAG